MARKATRAAQGSGTIRQRPDGRWEARFTVGRDPGTGKQVQRSVYGKTQKEVRQKLQQAAVALDDGIYTAPSKLTVKQWLETWSAEYMNGVKASTANCYKGTINAYLVPGLGAVKLSSLSPVVIQAYYNSLGRDRGDKPPLSPKTIKCIHGVLHKALNQAVKLGLIRYNPSDAATLPRMEKREIVPLDDTAIGLFLEAIRGSRFECLFLVDLFTGMRKSEILGLRWECIDFEKGALLVDRQLQMPRGGAKEYTLAPLKNDRPRRITPAPSVMQALKAHKREQAEQRIKAGSLWQTDPALGDLVFTNELGRHLAHNTVSKEYKRLVASIGMPEARFHDLRHSYAVAALQSGDDVKTVQETLGHHTAAFTLDVYGHVTDHMRQESAARMERFIKGVQPKS